MKPQLYISVAWKYWPLFTAHFPSFTTAPASTCLKAPYFQTRVHLFGVGHIWFFSGDTPWVSGYPGRCLAHADFKLTLTEWIKKRGSQWVMVKYKCWHSFSFSIIFISHCSILKDKYYLKVERKVMIFAHRCRFYRALSLLPESLCVFWFRRLAWNMIGLVYWVAMGTVCC